MLIINFYRGLFHKYSKRVNLYFFRFRFFLLIVPSRDVRKRKDRNTLVQYIQSMEKVSSALVCRAAALHPLATRVPALCLEASVPVDRDKLGILKLAFMTRRPKFSR